MAKAAKPKKTREANPRSRAAKRDASPSIDVDKSLKEAPRVSYTAPPLATVSNGGIKKVRKKVKPMKRGQRARQEQGLARAEAVMNQMTKKLESALSRQKARRDRSAVWEEVNDASKDEKRNAPKFQLLADGGDDDDWEDEPQAYTGDTEMKVVDGVQVPATAGSKLVVVDRTASTNGSDDEDFEGIT